MWWLILLPLLLSGCKSDDETLQVARAEPVVRKSTQKDFAPRPLYAKPAPLYPWQQKHSGRNTRITKEHFRCRGSFGSPVRTAVDKNGNVVTHFDCGGVDRHGLYLRDGKEFIYPILLDLLNYLQSKTGHKVIVTSGHRCPDHNTYVDSSPGNSVSRHMIGAAVTFYVQDVEPGKVVVLIQNYYKERYPSKKEFCQFETKSDSDVATPSCFNKELYIKLYRAGEGRNFDNSHPFPYLALQVRYDTARDQKVVYSWDDGFRNYLRK